MKTYKTDGKEIRKIREVLGWSQADLANKAGCSEKTVQRAEKSQEIKKEFIDYLAGALQVKPGLLITGEDNIPHSEHPTFTKLSAINSSEDFLKISHLNSLKLNLNKSLIASPDLSHKIEANEDTSTNLLVPTTLEWEVSCEVDLSASELIASTVNCCRKILGLDWGRNDSRYVEDHLLGETANIIRLGQLKTNINMLTEKNIYVHGGIFERFVFNSPEKKYSPEPENVFKLLFSHKDMKKIKVNIDRGVYSEIENITKQEEEYLKEQEEIHKALDDYAQEENKRMRLLTNEEIVAEFEVTQNLSIAEEQRLIEPERITKPLNEKKKIQNNGTPSLKAPTKPKRKTSNKV